jgi:hypothetical protein
MDEIPDTSAKSRGPSQPSLFVVVCNGSDTLKMLMSFSRQVTSGDGGHKNQTFSGFALIFFETNAEPGDQLGIGLQ